MTKNRWWRFFKNDGKALIMAFDHGGGGNIWIDPAKVIPAAVEGGIDGLLSTYGVLKNFKKEISQIGTMLRMEVFGSSISKSGNVVGSPYSVEDAVRLGADGIMFMGFVGTDKDTETMQYIANVNVACEKWGLVTSAEMLPNGFSKDPEDRTLEKMNIACRVAAEIGIDFVKTQFTGPEFKKVVDNCYVPILVLGGAKVPDERAVLQNAKDAMDAGCKGLVIGRNVWEHKNIAGMASALKKIVHENASVDEALKEIK